MHGLSISPFVRLFLVLIFSCESSVSLEINRKAFVAQSASLLATQTESYGGRTTDELLTAKTLQWDDTIVDVNGKINWSQIRYGSSSLQDSRTPASARRATYFPPWLNGYWLATYKFKGVRFPQGRDKINLRVAGAGLGTCLSLPNVGVNPPSHCVKFLEDANGCYEDVAYNLPRRFEAFYSGAKVLTIQTGETELSPKCFVTGQGCLKEENPRLHAPSTRARLEFAGSTRQGPVTQTIDTTLVRTDCTHGDNRFLASRNYVQLNAQQELQTYYRELLVLELVNDTGFVNGHVRVAGFLPGDSISYDDNSALVLYDYKVSLQSIDEAEARQI